MCAEARTSNDKDFRSKSRDAGFILVLVLLFRLLVLHKEEEEANVGSCSAS